MVSLICVLQLLMIVQGMLAFSENKTVEGDATRRKKALSVFSVVNVKHILYEGKITNITLKLNFLR